jgi:hypothetical protein
MQDRRTNSMVLGLVDLRTGIKGNVILTMEASSCVSVSTFYIRCADSEVPHFFPQIYTPEIGRIIQSKDLAGITTTMVTALNECFGMVEIYIYMSMTPA